MSKTFLPQQTVKPLPKTTTVFKFLHITDPSIVSEEKLKNSIVENADIASSEFMSIIDGITTQQAKDDAISNFLPNFSPLKTVKQVKNIHPDMFTFADWLNSNSYATQNDVTQKVSGLSAFSAQQENTLWDNLYYQALTTKDIYTRDAIISMLRANNFLNEFTSYTNQNPQQQTFSAENQEKFTKLAKASVAVPTELVVREKISSTNTATIDSFQKQALEKLQLADIAMFQIKRLTKSIDEIKAAYQKFNKEQDDEYKQAKATYDADILDIIANSPISQETGEAIVSSYPVFNFSSQLEFNQNYITSLVSNDGLKLYLENIKNSDLSVNDTINTMEEKLTHLYDLLISNTNKNSIVKAFGGIQINVNKNPVENGIIFHAVKLYAGENLYSIFLTQYTNNPDNIISSVSIIAQKQGSNPVDSTSNKSLLSNDTHVTHQLFKEGIPINSTSEQYTLQGSFYRKGGGTSSPISDVILSNGGPVIYTPNNSSVDGLPGNATHPMYGVTKIGLGIYRRVEQEICCYVPGEVSHIENILAREYKERSTRSLVRSETTTEESTEREVENLKDTTSTERYEMQSEVSKVLQKDQSVNVSTSASMGIDGGVYDANFDTSASYTISSSSTNSFNNSESYAKDVTERALKRVVEKTSYKRTAKMLREYEDINKHGFDNKLGDKHVTGIYRWVDKIYKNKLMNYGKRLIYDFMIPEPSKNFKNWMSNNTSNVISLITEPINPKSLGIFSDINIVRSNYANIASLYGADVEPCPLSSMEIPKSFSENPGTTGVKSDPGNVVTGAYEYELEIPEGYGCSKFKYHICDSSYGDGGSDAKFSNTTGVSIRIANHHESIFNHDFRRTIDHHGSYVGIGGTITGDMGISITTRGIASFSLNVIANCELTSEAYHQWQASTYMKILEAYRRRYQEYKDAKAAEPVVNTNEKIDYNINPTYGRTIEQRELKRCAIELMTKPFANNMGMEHYNGPTSGNYYITQNTNLEQHASQVRFFEEAFDWSLSSYTFFPYYWGDETKWVDLFHEKSSADHLFQAFLQSGMSRLTVPVRPGYEKAVLFYLDTGILWLGQGYTLDLSSPLYKSIDQLLEVTEGEMEGEPWFTRVPTDLTIVQSDSAPLQANGLPCHCCDEDTELYCSPIGQGSSIMTGNNTTNGLTLEQILASISTIINEGGDVVKEIVTMLYGNKGGAASENCMKVFEDFIGFIGTYNNTINDYTNSVIDCTSALANLNSQLSSLNSMITDATGYGCDTSIMQAKHDEIVAKIAEITAVCNP